MYSAATVNRFKPAGRPRQFLLQLVSNLTSILTVFLINLIKNKDYGKSQIFCYVLRNFLFFPVLITVAITFIIIIFKHIYNYGNLVKMTYLLSCY